MIFFFCEYNHWLLCSSGVRTQHSLCKLAEGARGNILLRVVILGQMNAFHISAATVRFSALYVCVVQVS